MSQSISQSMSSLRNVDFARVGHSNQGTAPGNGQTGGTLAGLGASTQWAALLIVWIRATENASAPLPRLRSCFCFCRARLNLGWILPLPFPFNVQTLSQRPTEHSCNTAGNTAPVFTLSHLAYSWPLERLTRYSFHLVPAVISNASNPLTRPKTNLRKRTANRALVPCPL